MLNVKEFGAVGDGVTDDTIAIKKAIKASKNFIKEKIYFPAGSYLVSETLFINNTVIIEGDNRENTEIIGKTNGPVISATGNKPILARNNFSIPKHDEINANLALVSNSRLTILDPKNGSFSNFRDYYKAGQILTISANGFTDSCAVRDYVNCELYYTERPSVLYIEHISIRTLDSDPPYVVELKFFHNLKLHECCFSGSSKCVVFISHSSGVSVNRCTIEQSYPDSYISGTNYGLCIANSSRIIISDCEITGLRHGLTFGGTDIAPNINNQNIKIKNSIIRSTGPLSALDFHGNCENAYVELCDIFGGLSVGGNTISIDTCNINGKNKSQSGIAVYGSEIIGSISLLDNIIRGFVTSSYKNRATIFLPIQRELIKEQYFNISGNKIHSFGENHSYKTGGIFIGNYSDYDGPELYITNNDVSSDYMFENSIEIYTRSKKYKSLTMDSNINRYGKISYKPTDFITTIP